MGQLEAENRRLKEVIAALGRGRHVELITERLSRIAADAQEVVFVSEVANGDIEGWIHAGQREVVGSSPRAEIIGLVVESAARSKGVGRQLVRKVEHWAATRGLHHIVVRSNVNREAAHLFYQRIGFVPTKTQRVYERRLTASDAVRNWVADDPNDGATSDD